MVRKHSGYTLIEILIVMLIISVVGGIAMLTMSHNQNAKLDNLTKYLNNTFTLAEEQAMLRPAVLGLVISDAGFQFFEYQDTQKNQNHWQAIEEGGLGLHYFPSGTQIILKIQDKRVELANDFSHPQPQIIFSTNGDVTPFTLLIGQKNATPRFIITGEAGGNIANEVFHAN